MPVFPGCQAPIGGPLRIGGANTKPDDGTGNLVAAA